MSFDRASLLTLLLLCGTLATSLEGESPPTIGRLDLAVERPGLAAVPLDGAAIVRDGLDLRLDDPAGAPVTFALRPTEVDGRAVSVIAVERRAEAVDLILDVGPSSLRHRRLHFVPSTDTLADDVLLWTGEQPGTWSGEPVRADVFRLGASTRLRRGVIDYPPTRARFLRIRWPDASGPPGLEDARVEVASDRAAPSIPLAPRCQALSRSVPERIVDCLVRLPAAGSVARLHLTPSAPLTGPRDIVRLSEWTRAGWARTITAPLDSSRRVGLVSQGSPEQTRRSRVMRLEVMRPSGDFSSEPIESGDDSSEPPTLGLLAELRPMDLVFHAQVPGTYTLSWGSRRPAPSTASRLAGDIVLRPPATPAEASLPEPWPDRLGPAAPLPNSASRRSPMTIDAEPGEVARWTLDAAALRATSGNANHLRLVAGDRQVPFVVESMPVRLAAANLVPAGLDEIAETLGAGWSGATLDAADPSDAESWPLSSQLRLTAAGPFDRQVAVLGELTQPESAGTGRPKAPVRRLAESRWSCPEPTEAHCSVDLPIPADVRSLVVAIRDGDSRPLPRIGAERWASATSLQFVVPTAAVEVALLEQPAPRQFDLGGLAAILRAEPAVEATVAWAEPAGEWTAPPWILPSVLTAAAILLLGLLSRALRGHPGESG